MTLGKKIKELRKLKGWRQQDVADKTGLKRPHISRIERDDYDNWELDTIAKLSKGFEIHPRVLLVASGLFDGASTSNALANDPDMQVFFTQDWPDMSQSEREIVCLTIRAMKQAKDKRLGKTP
jgi:transcriptional regulator with XRE-family HTH domain